MVYDADEALNCLGAPQVNEEEGDKLMELEQKFNEIRRPVYLKRNEIIKTIPDFWLTSVSDTSFFAVIFFEMFNG